MTQAIEIDEASIGDIDVIMRIMDDAFDPRHGEAWTSDQCRATLLLPGYRLLVASVAGDAVGFVLSRTVASESEMMLLAVASGSRRSGIGRALVGRWLDECRAERVERTFLEVREGNSAIEFYRTLDFVEIGRRPAYYSGDNNARSDAITMTSALN